VPIHERLLADTHSLGKFDVCRLLLHRNAVVPWMILVPDRVETELLELPRTVRETVLDESARVAAFVQSHFGSPKINFAAIGNIVPQLHLHVVGRDPTDICWPAPVWGNLTEERSYPTVELESITAQLTASYDLLYYAEN
jgi:diadenosine tetraphosphate (Ap4A) HIT family hydrolase